MKHLISLLLFVALLTACGEKESFPPAPENPDEDAPSYDFTGSATIPEGVWGNDDYINPWSDNYEVNNVTVSGSSVVWERNYYTKNHNNYLHNTTITFNSGFTLGDDVCRFDTYYDCGGANYLGFPFNFEIKKDTLFIYLVYELEGNQTTIPGGTWLHTYTHDWNDPGHNNSYLQYEFRTGAETGRDTVDYYVLFQQEREEWQEPMISFEYEIAGDNLYMYELGTDVLRYSFRWKMDGEKLILVSTNMPDTYVTYKQPLD